MSMVMMVTVMLSMVMVTVMMSMVMVTVMMVTVMLSIKTGQTNARNIPQARDD